MKKVIETNRICEYCNKPFTAYNASKKFCSSSCRVQNHKIRHGIPFPDWSSTEKYKRVPSSVERNLADKIKELKSLEDTRKLKDIAIKEIENNYYKAKTDLDNTLEKPTNHHDFSPYAASTLLLKEMGINYAKERRAHTLGNYKGQIRDFIITKQQKIVDQLLSEIDTGKTELEELEYKINTLTKQIHSYQKSFDIEEFKDKGKIISVSEIREMVFDLHQFQEPYSNIFGHTAKSFLGMLYGSKGSGKSTFALEFANYFALNDFGTVLYFPLEEGQSVTFQQKIVRNDITDKIDISINDNWEQIKKQSQSYALVVIDSTVGLSAAEIKDITYYRTMYNTSFLLIFQATKDGEAYKGASNIQHDCDIVLEAKNGEIIVEKNRYANIVGNTYKIKAYNQ